jgi:glycosyltransferase involved in cell wall biosynthesis
MKFSLVIPCYNEAANLPLLLERGQEVARQPNCELILVDNGSTDNSTDVLSKLLPDYPGCRSIRVEKNQGYGFGILSGLRAATGDVLGWTHADMQTDPQDALRGLALFEQHGPNIFVKGRRYGRPFGDVLFTAGMSVFETILLSKPMWDINAQPTIFSRAFFESWHEPPYDFSLDLFLRLQYGQAFCLLFRRPSAEFAPRFLDAALRADVEHRAHPAGVLALDGDRAQQYQTEWYSPGHDGFWRHAPAAQSRVDPTPQGERHEHDQVDAEQTR